MEDRQRIEKSYWLVHAAILVLQPAFTYLAGFFRGFSDTELISSTVTSGLSAGVVVFLFLYERLEGRLAYDNDRHWKRFALFYTIAFLAALLFSLLPGTGWPYLVIFIGLAIYSNTLVGVCSGALLLSLSMLMTPGVDIHVFFLYLTSGIIGCILFSRLDKNFKVGMPVFIVLLLFAVLVMANMILFENRSLAAEQFFVPGINLFVCFLLLLILLKSFHAEVTEPHRGRYLEINDQQYPLLLQLKETSYDDYMRTIHTVHFSELIANRMSCDVNRVKTCAYYYRIGAIAGEKTWENVRPICEKHHFPRDAAALLKECLTEAEHVRNKEAAVVLLSDYVIGDMLSAKEEKPDEKPDYQAVITALFDRIKAEGFLDHCNISIEEYLTIKEVFLGENLYYDFFL